jgi:hypothetical protein
LNQALGVLQIPVGVLTAYFPAGTLSSFAKQAEHRVDVINQSIYQEFLLLFVATTCDPGTNHAVTFSAFFALYNLQKL